MGKDKKKRRERDPEESNDVSTQNGDDGARGRTRETGDKKTRKSSKAGGHERDASHDDSDDGSAGGGSPRRVGGKEGRRREKEERKRAKKEKKKKEKDRDEERDPAEEAVKFFKEVNAGLFLKLEKRLGKHPWLAARTDPRGRCALHLTADRGDFQATLLLLRSAPPHPKPGTREQKPETRNRTQAWGERGRCGRGGRYCAASRVPRASLAGAGVPLAL
jgi:hypothetical protein